MYRSLGYDWKAGREVATAVSFRSMSTVVLFEDACKKHGIKISESLLPTIVVTPVATLNIPLPQEPVPSESRLEECVNEGVENFKAQVVALTANPDQVHGKIGEVIADHVNELSNPTEFVLFKHLPAKVRYKIWGYAVSDIEARTLPIQPYSSSHPALSAVCKDSRVVFLEKYHMLHSRQAGRMSGFSISINFRKDLVFLNRRFIRHPMNPRVTPLTEATMLYGDWLKPVRQLAINLKDTRHLLPRSWCYSQVMPSWYAALWKIIGRSCPELRLIWFVDDEDDEAVGLGNLGPLIDGGIPHAFRIRDWNCRWACFRSSLESAKRQGAVRRDLVLKVMDGRCVAPEKLEL